MLNDITHETFKSIIGESLDLRAGEVAFQAQVEEVSLLRPNPESGQQPFSVLLQAQDMANHGQQIYLVRHEALGELSLFLVPVGPGTAGMRYEIIFN
jgi:hypothetical protein